MPVNIWFLEFLTITVITTLYAHNEQIRFFNPQKYREREPAIRFLSAFLLSFIKFVKLILFIDVTLTGQIFAHGN